MIQVTRTYLPPLADYQKHLQRIWDSGQLTNNGVLVRELAQGLCRYLNIEQIELVANGTLALQLAIKALDIKGEVITTPFSYVATTTAIAWEGCQPVFVDIEEQTFCMNPDLIEAAITERTTAILATHVYGYPCDVLKIETIAKKYGLKVIYDAAHCFGVKLHGKSLALYGDASIFSFHATKLFHTAEGGAVVCQDEAVANRISLMKKFGHFGEDEYLDIGINAKMSELHAAMGLCVLPKVDELIGLRRRCTEKYDELLNCVSLQRPGIPADVEYNYAYYPFVFEDSESMHQVRQALINNGIMPRRYFYPSLNTLHDLFKTRENSCPISESIAERVLALPLSHQLTSDEIILITSVIRDTL